MTNNTLPQFVARLRHIKQSSGSVPSFLAKVTSAPAGVEIAPYVWVGYAGMGEMMWVDVPANDVPEIERLLAEGKYIRLTDETITLPIYTTTDVRDLHLQRIDLI